MTVFNLELKIDRILEKGLSSDPDAIALCSIRGAWTWKQLRELSFQAVRRYQSKGLVRGDVVGFFATSSPELIANYLACFELGLIVLPLKTTYSKREIQQSIEIAQAKTLVWEPGISSIEFSSISVEDLMVMTTVDFEIAFPAPTPSFKNDKRDLCGVFMTSGSTGVPKGVVHDRHSFAQMLRAIVEGFNITSEDVILPVAYFSELLFTLATLSAGGRVILSTSRSPDELLKLLRTWRPTIFGMLPGEFFAFLSSGKVEKRDFAFLRLCLSGGDTVTTALREAFRLVSDIEILEDYGMTEFGVSHSNPCTGLNKHGSVGLPLPGIECSIRNEKGQVADEGMLGELWVRSSSSMVGYLTAKGFPSRSKSKQWIQTGDWFELDHDGYYWMRGRIKGVLVVKGMKVYPQEIEQVLNTHPLILSSVVTEGKKTEFGDYILAFVVRNPKLTIEEIYNHCAAFLADYKRPQEFVFVDSIPYTDTGKIDRLAIRKSVKGLTIE